MPAMRKSMPYLRLIALAATYVVVLQALLLPLAVAAAGPMAERPCVTAAADKPASANDTGCACAAGCGTQCCAPGVLGPAHDFLLVAPTDFYVMRMAPVLATVAHATLRLPQIPRAPPAA